MIIGATRFEELISRTCNTDSQNDSRRILDKGSTRFGSIELTLPMIEILKHNDTEKGLFPTGFEYLAGSASLLTLEGFLESKNVWYRFIHKPETVHTLDASKLIGVNLNQLTKNLVGITMEGDYVLLVVPGNRRVDLKKASQILGTKNISLIPFGEAESISGYPPGGTPSVGHKMPLSVIVDESLLKYETIFCGGGTRDKILELRTQDVLLLNKATVGDLAE